MLIFLIPHRDNASNKRKNAQDNTAESNSGEEDGKRIKNAAIET